MGFWIYDIFIFTNTHCCGKGTILIIVKFHLATHIHFFPTFVFYTFAVFNNCHVQIFNIPACDLYHRPIV